MVPNPGGVRRHPDHRGAQRGQAKSISRSKRDLMLRTMLIESFGIDVQVVATAGTDAGRAAPPDEPSMTTTLTWVTMAD